MYWRFTDLKHLQTHLPFSVAWAERLDFLLDFILHESPGPYTPVAITAAMSSSDQSHFPATFSALQ